MELKKANDTYDVYTARLSYLELTVLADALRDGGEGAVADELRRSIEWHIDKLPGPGEDAKKKKEEEENGETAVDATANPVEAEGPNDIGSMTDELLPAPPEEGEEIPLE